MPLAKITRAAVEVWLAALTGDRVGAHGRRLSPGSIEKIHQVFRKTMAAAYDEDRIPHLPCPKSPPIPRGKQKPVRFLTEGEVVHLASIIDPTFEAMILVVHHWPIRAVFADEAGQTGLSCSGPRPCVRAAPRTPEGPAGRFGTSPDDVAFTVT